MTEEKTKKRNQENDLTKIKAILSITLCLKADKDNLQEKFHKNAA
ncbi:hypothetical protein [Nitrosomonas sp. sh817]|nr:hypothetical protein [Nitrosomonas sp. sh817]WMJ09134.1 hypothetical protein RBH92_02740 [Nitrosomonas sp. sh817]